MTSSAVGNVILNISTGKTDFASIKGFIDLMGQAIRVVADFAKKQDEYIDALQKSTINVDKAVQATGNLIETQKLFQATAKLSTAGLQLTEEQFRNLSVAAADMGEITGDANGELDKLVQGLISGNERGLRPFGISLEGITGKADKQREIIKQLGEKYGQLEVHADTLSDGFIAVGDAFSDLTGTIWADINKGSGGITSFFDGIASSISRLSSKIREMGMLGGATSWFFSIPGMSEMLLGQKTEDIQRVLSQSYAGQGSKSTNEMVFTEEELYGKSRTKSARGGGGSGVTARLPDMTFSLDEIATANENQLFSAYGREQTAWERRQFDYSAGELIGEETQRIQNEQNAYAESVRIANAEMERREKFAASWMLTLDEMREKEVSFAEDFSTAWQSAMRGMTAGTLVAQGAITGLRRSVQLVSDAVIDNAKLTPKMFFEMVKEVSKGIGIEATVRALMEGAMAVASYARQDYKTGSEHVAAAGMFTATAALAFSVAAGSKAIANSMGGSSGSQLGGAREGKDARGGSGVPSYASSDYGGRTEVVVVLEGDAEGIFKVTKKGSRRSVANGSGGFAET